MHSTNAVNSNIDALEQLFPDCITESIDENGQTVKAVDFDKLKASLSYKVVEGDDERYNFTWPQKSDAIRLANSRTSMTLRPCREESLDFDNTGNLYIEGDNLDVLKVLRNTYRSRVKMIYIDPPYNTGNDFVYEDDFTIDAYDYLVMSHQRDEQGNRLVKNTDSNGRFHTDWLNMIYPRLKLARELLRDDGVIFISIDDNELQNLLKLCSEIFGENHLAGIFPWRKRTAKSDVPFGVSQDYEWVVCYAKSGSLKVSTEGTPRKYYETPDFPGRPWRTHDLKKQTTASERPNSFFDIVNPKTGEIFPANPNRTWCITKDSIKEYIAQDRIIYPGDYSFLKITQPVMRYWKSDDVKKDGDSFGRSSVSTNFPKDIGLSQDGTKEITQIFDGQKIFNYPKPTSLLIYLISILNDKNATILDFFSGSASTAHAVMHMNAKDGGSRKFIMVQLPEEIDSKSEAYKAGYRNICEIGKDRISRAGAILKSEYGEQANNVDVGFRVLKLDSSNMEDAFYLPHEMSQESLVPDNIKPDRKSEDLLFQTMLETDVLLSSSISMERINNKEVFIVRDGYLMACFDEHIDLATVKAIAERKPVYFITRDGSLSSDDVADNMEQIFLAISANTTIKVL